MSLIAFSVSGVMNFAVGIPIGFSAVKYSAAERKTNLVQQFEKIITIAAIAAVFLGFLISLIFTTAPLTAGLLFKSWLVTQTGLVAGIAVGSLATSIGTCFVKKFCS